MPIKPCDPLQDESVSDILMGKWAAVVRLAETGASSVYGRLQGFRRMSRNTDCYRDPFWLALDAAILELDKDPDILYKKSPDWTGGLNAVEINRLAAEVGMGDGRVFQQVEEPPGKQLVLERFLLVWYPDARPPIKLKTGGLVPAKRLAEHARLVQDRLRCWQTEREHALERKSGGTMRREGRARAKRNELTKRERAEKPRLPKPTAHSNRQQARGGQETSPLSELYDSIPVADVVRAVGRKAGRSDNLAEKMKRRGYPIVVAARKFHCQRANAKSMFPDHREQIEKI